MTSLKVQKVKRYGHKIIENRDSRHIYRMAQKSRPPCSREHNLRKLLLNNGLILVYARDIFPTGQRLRVD